jgi:hypothetical protein
MSPWELGAMDDEEIGAAVAEVTIKKMVSAMTKINEDLYRALGSYKMQVAAGRWLGGPIGLLIYSADDVEHATWEVENWHTGALKWMTEGTNALRKGTITEKQWGDMGLVFAKNAESMLTKLRDASGITRAKQFASTMPAAFQTVLKAAGGAAGAGLKAIGAGLPWWVFVIGGTAGVILLLGAVSDTARVFKGGE